jgi:protocatechuate 3,4-dioxygenase beta subunit
MNGNETSAAGTRRWRGRVLPRQDEEVVDQGLSFDVQTLVDRRSMLRVLGLGAVGLGVAACSDGSTSAQTSPGAASTGSTGSIEEIPDETAGPYPGDGSNGPDVLEESGIVRSDIRSSFGDASGTAEGVPMTLELSLKDLVNGGSAFAGVAVYVWHCDREGRYSLYSEGIDGENYLRGVQIADASGVVRFSSIYPACYSGRWPHIHFEVYPDADAVTDAANAIATSQVALPKDICTTVYAESGYEQSVRNLGQVSLSDDNVFGDDSGARQIATVTGSVADGYLVRLTVGVDTRTTPTGGAAPGGAPGGSPAGGPGGGGTGAPAS